MTRTNGLVRSLNQMTIKEQSFSSGTVQHVRRPSVFNPPPPAQSGEGLSVAHSDEYCRGSRSQTDLVKRGSAVPRELLAGTAGVLIVVLGFVGWSIVRFGGVSDAVSYLNGKRILAVPEVISLGRQANGTRCPVRIRLRNLADQPVRIIGAETSCACVATTNLPVLIGARQSVVLDATMLVDGKPGKGVEQTIDYLTDLPLSAKVRVTLRTSPSSVVDDATSAADVRDFSRASIPEGPSPPTFFTKGNQ